jgi:hypothetical protein
MADTKNDQRLTRAQVPQQPNPVTNKYKVYVILHKVYVIMSFCITIIKS